MWISSSKSSPSQDNKNRRQGADFLGCQSQSRRSHYENFWEPPRQPGTNGQSRSHRSADRQSDRQLSTWQQNQRPPRISYRTDKTDCVVTIGKTLKQLRNPLQKRQRHWESKKMILKDVVDPSSECPDQKILKIHSKKISKALNTL